MEFLTQIIDVFGSFLFICLGGAFAGLGQYDQAAVCIALACYFRVGTLSIRNQR